MEKSETRFNGFRAAHAIFSENMGVNTCERRVWMGGNIDTLYKSGPTAEAYGVR